MDNNIRSEILKLAEERESIVEIFEKKFKPSDEFVFDEINLPRNSSKKSYVITGVEAFVVFGNIIDVVGDLKSAYDFLKAANANALTFIPRKFNGINFLICDLFL
jgi:hypothetical protein